MVPIREGGRDAPQMTGSSGYDPAVDRAMAPRRCPRPHPWRRAFADVRWGDHPGWSAWAQPRHRDSYKREARGSESGAVMTETEVREMSLLVAGRGP